MKKILSVAILLMVLSSCTSIEKEFDGRFMSPKTHINRFHATIEASSTDTKAYADENLKVLWNAWDQISVFNQNTYNSLFIFTGEDGSNAGDFDDQTTDVLHTGNELDYIYAVYPYSSANTIDNTGSTISLILPTTQQYKEHSFGIGASTMIAVTDNSFLSFKNLCGYLQLRLYGDDVKVSRIQINGNNGEKIAGNANVSVGFGKIPTIAMVDEEASNTITIVCDPPLQLGTTKDEYTDFWIVLPPVTFTDGFTITVTDKVGRKFEKSTSNSLTIRRSIMDWMSPLKVVPVDTEYPTVDYNTGLAEMYTHLKYMYGHEAMIDHQEAGTDEYTIAESATASHRISDMNVNDTQWSASNNPCSQIWNYAIRNINTANGALADGAENGIDAALLAELHFFRAFDYFILVQTFGGVPLDFGSGALRFHPNPIRQSTRNTVDEVYDNCIFPDLEYAVANLPDSPRITGGVTKTAARLYLSKAYLTYAWWNENPKNIATYPATTGRNASKAPAYFQKAYDMAMSGINNPGPYGLENTYYDLWVGSNLYSKEAVLFADYNTWDNYTPGALTGYQGGDGQNTAYWMMNPNYTNMQVATDDKPVVISYGYNNNGKEAFAGGKSQAITRAGEQGYGRPWARMAPVHGVFYNTFNDQRDSRLDVTFNLTYKQNQTRYYNKTVYGAMCQPVDKDGAILKFIPNQPDGTVSYPSDRGVAANGANSFAAGTMEGENAYVIEYNHIGRRNFVGPWKHSIWLTTGSTAVGIIKTDTEPGQVNIGNPTPNIISRFAEFYFVAAEAAIKGASGGQSMAHQLMTVIRARAGKWTHSVAEGTALVAKAVSRDYSAELVAAIPATIDIDWLLDEYSREFFAEYRRWYDLTRTQTWIERASTYLMGEDYNRGDTMEKLWTRSIDKHHYLRPIPISYLNDLDMSDEEIAAQQNPGYSN